jgi:long-chain acyl-CoA synthetase
MTHWMQGGIEPMGLADEFTMFAERRRGHWAVVDGRSRLTYDDVDGYAGAAAQRLLDLGVQAGDRIVMQFTNSVEAAVVVWAVFRAGAVLVPVHANARTAELREILEDCGASVAILGKDQAHQATDIAAATAGRFQVVVLSPGPSQHQLVTGAVRHWTMDELARADAIRPSGEIPDESLAAILYTSGSTGSPKGVMLSHANMRAALKAVNAYLELNSSDTIYSPLPLSSSYGLYQLVLGLAIGATVVLDRSFAFPAKSLELIATERATVFAGVPTMYAWLARSTILGRFDLRSLRILTSAAAALPIAHAMSVREKLPHARLFVMYGQTECKRISYLDPVDLDRKLGSVGRGMPMQELAVVDERGERVSPGEVGELAVAGPHVMRGYWNRPEETARKLRPIAGDSRLWLHTDDLFRIDEDGYLFFVGRRDDVFKAGGHKVSPAEIEEVIVRMPGVVEAAVIGVPDADWGHVARAFVVPVEGTGLAVEDVIRHCSARLPGYMVPRSVEFVRALPKTESGKVKKRDLRQ